MARPSAKTSLVVCYLSHHDQWYFNDSLQSFRAAGPVFWFRDGGSSADDTNPIKATADSASLTIVKGSWQSREACWKAAKSELLKRGYRWCIFPEPDEIIEPELLRALAAIAASDLADQVYASQETYWHSPRWVVNSRQDLNPLLMVKLEVVEYAGERTVTGGRPLVLSGQHGVVHSLAFCGPAEHVEQMLARWDKANVANSREWFRNVWRAWSANPLMTDLHPTRPQVFRFAERVSLRPALLPVTDFEPVEQPSFTGLPETVSVIVPIPEKSESVATCLAALSKVVRQGDEILLVGKFAPKNLSEVVAKYASVRVVRDSGVNTRAGAYNAGFRKSKGDVVLFLSPTVTMPANSWGRLLEAVWSSGTIAASGPRSNANTSNQQILATYTTPETIEQFCQVFAMRSVDDSEVDDLDGSCLACRRAALVELASNPFDEALAETRTDVNDLCYRLRRAGYRLVVSERAFVHEDSAAPKGEARLVAPYLAKWHEDIECGFASHLSGTSTSAIKFDQLRHPDRLRGNLSDAVSEANISLCMIVKNEERSIRACLESARPFFTEMIVVDTGSTDATKEIALSCGAKVFDFPWPDSFSVARNESLRHATGNWIFWMDADDTLQLWCGERIVRAAATAPSGIAAFIVPVQFVEDGIASGTRVDHIKLFRNLPGVRFEGRIHEQVLNSLKPHGDVGRIGAHVLHSNYDTSDAGQARKKVRDSKLLKLDLDERPDHPFVLFNLGMTAHYGGRPDEAIDWLRQCITKSQTNESHVRKAYAMLGGSLHALGRTEEALATFKAGLTAVGNDPELRFFEGMYLTSLDRLEEAEASYLAIEDNTLDHFSSIDIGIIGHKRDHNLGVVYLKSGKYSEAQDCFKKACENNPRPIDSMLALFESCVKAGDHLAARQTLDRVLATCGPSPDWASMGARYSDAFGYGYSGLDWLRHEVEIRPKVTGTRLAFAQLLLNSGRQDEAIAHLRLLDDAGVAQATFFLGIEANRRGKPVDSLRWFERASQLNPNHQPSRDWIASLTKAIENTVPAPIKTC